jgi:hypothetical protein
MIIISKNKRFKADNISATEVLAGKNGTCKNPYNH